MKNRKILIGIIIILIVVYFSLSIGLNYLKKDNSNKTMYIGNYTKISVEDGKIKIVNDNYSLEKKEVNFYFNNKIVKGYITSNNAESDGGTKVYVPYDEDGKILFFQDAIIGFTDDLSVKFIEVDKQSISSLDEFFNYKKAANLTMSDDIELDYIEKATYDINNDGKKEEIYSIGVIIDQSEYRSVVYYKENGKYIVIKDLEEDYRQVNTTRLRLLAICDINEDNNYEYIVSKSLTEYGPNYYELYNLNDGNFVSIGDGE